MKMLITNVYCMKINILIMGSTFGESKHGITNFIVQPPKVEDPKLIKRLLTLLRVTSIGTQLT